VNRAAGVHRRTFLRTLLACVAVAGSLLVTVRPAHAAGAPLSSAGQRWALVSEANGLYVASEINDSGGHAGMLRARSTSVGGWETLTLHTADKGATATLRSEANGLYATAEVDDGGADAGMVRARGTTVGSWEQFSLVSVGSGLYALRSKANGLYVTTELNYTGSGNGMLRARAPSVGGWEKYRLVPVGGASQPPAPGVAGPDTVSVMSWNTCSNNGACPLYRATSTTMANTVTSWATNAFSPDALLLQEFCEKDAKPVELALESRTGRGWDVRFAPIQYIVAGTTTGAQKLCVEDKNGLDRGSYGIALAVPDANTWYAAAPLTSPPAYEQRTILCATVESRALNICAAHFSSALSEDDPSGTYRTRQVGELLSAAGRPGYRSIFGGDLNLTPPDSPSGAVPGALGPVYDAYQECDQSAFGGLRKGTPTDGGSKIDYIFGPASAGYQCRVASEATDSDHKPIYARVALS
jgi:endonuclease/exonuclease/phosphatase family metal-dependent hydrolase